MRATALLAVLAALAAATVLADDCPSNYDLMFVLDSSGSIDNSDFVTQLQFVYDLAANLTIGTDDVHVGLAQYSHDGRLEIGLSDNKQAFLDGVCPGGSCEFCYLCHSGSTQFVDPSRWTDGDGAGPQCCIDEVESCCCFEGDACQIPKLGYTTFPSSGLALARDQFDASTRGVPQIIIFTADGRYDSDDIDDTRTISQSLQNDGVAIIGVGVGSNIDIDQIYETASPGQLYEVNDFAALEGAIQDLVGNLCELTSASNTPSNTPSNSASPSVTASNSPSSSNTASQTATASVTASETAAGTPGTTPTSSESPSAPQTPADTPAATPASTPAATPASTDAATPDATPAQSPDPSPMSTPTASEEVQAGPETDDNSTAIIGGAVAGGVVVGAAAIVLLMRGRPKRARLSIAPRQNDDVELVINPMFMHNNARVQGRLAQVEGYMQNQSQAPAASVVVVDQPPPLPSYN